LSGDGVDQHDYVTSGGAQGYDAPDAIRADQIVIRGVRLPYWNFPAIRSCHSGRVPIQRANSCRRLYNN